MKRKTPLALLALTAALAVPGVASANANTADADCDGVRFSMPRGETGTVVTTRLDGRVVRTDTVATFGAPVVFTMPNPDRTAAHTWAIVVDSPFNADTSWSEAVPACETPTTTTVAPTTTTAPPVVPTTTTVDVPPPPVPPGSTVVVTTPPVPRPTTSTTAPPFVLPETGSDTWVMVAMVALTIAFVGVALVRGGRR